MPISRKYLHDKLILVLLSANAFLALACVILILLRFGASGGSNGYIVQYRQNLGISGFRTGSLANIVGFALYAPVVAVFNFFLSVRLYPLRRQLAIVVLSMGILLLILAIIVSNALLVLR